MSPNEKNSPQNDAGVSRRRFVAGAATIAGAAAAVPARTALGDQESGSEVSADISAQTQSGRLNQSVCKWCFKKMSLEEMAVEAKRLGLVGIDLLKADDFPTLKKHGLVCTMVSSHSLANGLCEPKFHEECLNALNEAIEAASAAGYRNVITFSGNARGMSRKEGMKNCVKALKEIAPVAEKAGVVLNMELLNSRVNHPDYMCDRSDWGIELCKQVGSDNFKLLYDIYHMQIMEG
ncbi:MAG: sugar phosphate isomerase/epimerase family protein, partial [Planctomycetota bacterium]